MMPSAEALPIAENRYLKASTTLLKTIALLVSAGKSKLFLQTPIIWSKND